MLDEIGHWSEIKLDILRDYAAAYSRILSAQTHPPFYHIYIDAFAGAGKHVSRATGEFVPGSPLNALLVQPPFREYHFIDLARGKVTALHEIADGRNDISVYEGDCNVLLLEKVFPRVQYRQYRRALCLLDPYGLHLDWHVIETAGRMRSIDLFLNFPVADMNRNVLRRDPDAVDETQAERMTRYWGDNSWIEACYHRRNLFGIAEKETNEAIASAFRARLLEVAGFKHVPQPMPMRNSRGAIVYYLFFASHRPVAEDIVRDIFSKYRDRSGA